ncbi:hypothetical protein TNCV_4445071 [Trichonephila clavipes]|nr:hypothetical protein TNCV_4445071 [Trichonephila clavipes]
MHNTRSVTILMCPFIPDYCKHLCWWPRFQKRLPGIVTCIHITQSTPVRCYSLFFGALLMCHSSNADTTSVTKPTKNVVPQDSFLLLTFKNEDEIDFRNAPRILTNA